MRSAFLLTIACVLLTPTEGFAVDLRGRVVNRAGKPLEGARIDIATAGPKVGAGIYCPSCYLDCRKWTRSDSAGKFVIADLNPTLKFRLVVTATGKQTSSTAPIDPAEGDMSITLLDFPKDTPARRLLKGIVLSEEGATISAAVISARGAKTPTSRWWGRVAASDAVTDDRGEFCMLLGDDYMAVDVQVSADGFPGEIALLEPGESQHRLTLGSGSTLRGRAMFKGQLQANAPIAVVQLNRETENLFIKSVPTTTKDDGTFEIKYLPPNQSYAVYTPVEMDPSGPVLRTAIFPVGRGDTTCDLGDLELVPAVTLAGKVRLANGGGLPEAFTITLGRTPAWDLVRVPVRPDGSFLIANLPPETYVFYPHNGNVTWDESLYQKYQRLRASAFGIRLDQSRSDLDLVIRPRTADDIAREQGPPTPLKENERGSQMLSGEVIDSNGIPVAGVLVSASQGWRSLPNFKKTGADGSFAFHDLPDVQLDIIYRPAKAVLISGSKGLILHHGFAWPSYGQRDIRLVFDERLLELPLELKPKIVP